MACGTALAVFLAALATFDVGNCEDEVPGRMVPFRAAEQPRPMLLKENCLSQFLNRFQPAIERDARRANQHFRHEHNQKSGQGRDIRAAESSGAEASSTESGIASQAVGRTCSTAVNVRKFRENCTGQTGWCLPTTLKKCTTVPLPPCDVYCPPFLVEPAQTAGVLESPAEATMQKINEMPASRGIVSLFSARAVAEFQNSAAPQNPVAQPDPTANQNPASALDTAAQHAASAALLDSVVQQAAAASAVNQNPVIQQESAVQQEPLQQESTATEIPAPPHPLIILPS